MATKQCYFCKKQVNLSKDKYVLLGTYNISKKITKPEEIYFHFECFRQWNLDKTKERAMNMLNQAKGQMMQTLMPMVNNTLSQLQNNPALQEVLQQIQPIQNFEITPVEKEQKKDGRRKRAIRKAN
jgi:hypothetical protein